ncbi:MAG TPA: hypothetical protein VNZ85_09005 [Caulobacter sp.]|nr:hypothetical protein [Caulobacter sp.]
MLEHPGMRPPLRITRAQLERHLTREGVLVAVRQALIDHAAGRYTLPAPTHLTFAGGDCHIKSGFLRGGDNFTIKMATGFYGNPRQGLPSASGLLLLCSQETGFPLALFEDEGYLTAWRTTAAAILAVQVAAPHGPLRVGIVGSGLQAELAAQWLPDFCDVEGIGVWGRNAERARALAARFDRLGLVSAHKDLPALCSWANVLVTTTPSSEPVIMSDWVQPGTHVVALGADNPGKVELDPALVARCALIATDDHGQCLHHGDFGHAVRAGLVREDADRPLGEMLAASSVAPTTVESGAVTMVDLTGLAAQDDAIASFFYRAITAVQE